MPIVVDTSAVIAVIIDEPEKRRIISVTRGNTLISPGSMPWEVGNAFSAMFKQKRITIEAAKKGFSIFQSIPLQFITPDFVYALEVAEKANIYAYDAYFLDCAIRHRAPLLTLDNKLRIAATSLDIDVLEV